MHVNTNTQTHTSPNQNNQTNLNAQNNGNLLPDIPAQPNLPQVHQSGGGSGSGFMNALSNGLSNVLGNAASAIQQAAQAPAGWGPQSTGRSSQTAIENAARERTERQAAAQRAMSEQRRLTNGPGAQNLGSGQEQKKKDEQAKNPVSLKPNDRGEIIENLGPIDPEYNPYYGTPRRKRRTKNQIEEDARAAQEIVARANDARDAMDAYNRETGPFFRAPNGRSGFAEDFARMNREDAEKPVNDLMKEVMADVKASKAASDDSARIEERARRLLGVPSVETDADVEERANKLVDLPTMKSNEELREELRNLPDIRYRTKEELANAAGTLLTEDDKKREPRFKPAERMTRLPGDKAFETHTFESGMSDKDMLAKVRKQVNADVSASIASRKNPEHMKEPKHMAPTQYDPDKTMSDNVKRAKDAAKGTADIIVNPLLVNVEGMHMERTESTRKRVDANVRYSTEEGRDVEGAIGMVMRIFNCSKMNALRLVFIRLGLGIDSQRKIVGEDLDNFVLPAVTFIEAANDIKKSMEQYGLPFCVVQGRPGGYTGTSRDDSGLFPVLGGTRCYPLGYMPKDMFADMSRDEDSPLHGKSEQEFYRNCAYVWMNEIQPRILANTSGPLAYQAAALNMAMDGLLGIDGVPIDMFNIPEYTTNRTKMQIEADLMDAGDESMISAFEEKKRLAPEIMGRWCRMNFKDAEKEISKVEGLEGELPGPGKQRMRGVLSGLANAFMSLEAAAAVTRLGLMITAPLEGLVATAQQQIVVSTQNAYRDHMSEDFRKSDYLKQVAESDDALEAIETYTMLMNVGGRTAVDAFRLDQNERKTRARYKKATKAEAVDFLKRWGVSQGSDVQQKIEKAMSFLMFGDGMLRKTKAQQFVDMALYEMFQSDKRGKVAFNTAQLEEIARSGIHRNGEGEALVSALIDTEAGYEAFKTMGITSLAMRTPAGRAMQVLLQKNGVTELAVRNVIGKFPIYGINKIARFVPMSNTISYVISNMVRSGMLKANQDLELSNSFARGFDKAAEMVSRVSDYQIGMSSDSSIFGKDTLFSQEFKTGLYKNLAYDAVMFCGNYLFMAAIMRGFFALFGGLIPPDDDDLDKITLPEEWIIKDLGVPIKAAWFMDDLMGCGMPLAYAWEISQGWDVRDKDGNVIGHVAGNSEKAKSVAASAFINMVSGFNEGNFVIDAIDFVNNFDQTLNDLARWNSSVDEARKYYGDEGKQMSEAELRREWLFSRAEGIMWDLFGTFTPPIISEILPGSRDSIWDDGYTHTTNKRYNVEEYGEDQAKSEWRTKRLSYVDAQRCRKTQDNVLAAFLADFLDTRDGMEYQYSNMPIDTVSDARTMTQESYENMFSIPLTLENGNYNLDLNGDGHTDTMEERQEVLFNEHAESLCQYINNEYMLAGKYPEMAVAEGFVIPYEARINAINYCYYMIGSKNRQGKIWKDFYERRELAGGWLPQNEFEEAQAEVQKYSDILYNYLNNEDIPWRAARYAHLSTDVNKAYVDENGNATNALDPNAREVLYDYGNPTGGLFPFTSPRDTGLNDYNSPLWDVMLDDEGNPINDMNRIYDEAESAGIITMGRWKDNNTLDMFTNGGVLERGDVLNMGVRAYETFEGTYPEALKNPTADLIAKITGIDSYIPGEETNPDKEDKFDSSSSSSSGGRSGGGRRYYGGRSYGGRRYTTYASSYASSYNPKIYAAPRQVYGDRAAGMSTRQPYTARTTYLRPGFSTKGSREAYRRSDI